MSLSSPTKYMKIALNEAQLAYDRGDLPIGAVIVDLENQQVIVQTGNKQSSVFDPTAHAEISAIREACNKLQTTFLTHHALVVTTEPCTMCISAIMKAKIQEVYFGVSIKELIANGFNLIPISSSKIAQKSLSDIKIVGSVLGKECLEQRLRYQKK